MNKWSGERQVVTWRLPIAFEYVNWQWFIIG